MGTIYSIAISINEAGKPMAENYTIQEFIYEGFLNLIRGVMTDKA